MNNLKVRTVILGICRVMIAISYQGIHFNIQTLAVSFESSMADLTSNSYFFYALLCSRPTFEKSTIKRRFAIRLKSTL